jgi:hypothetical protein
MVNLHLFYSAKQRDSKTLLQMEGTARRSLVASFLEDRGGECTKEEEEFIMFTVGDL